MAVILGASCFWREATNPRTPESLTALRVGGRFTVIALSDAQYLSYKSSSLRSVLCILLKLSNLFSCSGWEHPANRCESSKITSNQSGFALYMVNAEADMIAFVYWSLQILHPRCQLLVPFEVSRIWGWSAFRRRGWNISYPDYLGDYNLACQVA